PRIGCIRIEATDVTLPGAESQAGEGNGFTSPERSTTPDNDRGRVTAVRVVAPPILAHALTALLNQMDGIVVGPAEPAVILIAGIGWESLEEVMPDPSLPARPALLLLTNGSEEELSEASTLGVEAFVATGDTPEILERAIHLAANHQPHFSPCLLPRLFSAFRRRSQDAYPAAVPDGVKRQLTERELQIAAAAARGWTSKRIGIDLFLSEATVKFHLTRVYRKLGIHRRCELSALLSGLTARAADPLD
ncbi:MAG: response regulator transcription factor, partial [Chloroflexi bacterium]|nr:response regulator transcription factor [Chloroflexota bacterium]